MARRRGCTGHPGASGGVDKLTQGGSAAGCCGAFDVQKGKKKRPGGRFGSWVMTSVCFMVITSL